MSGGWSAAKEACAALYREALDAGQAETAAVAARIHGNCSFNLNDFAGATAWAERSLQAATQAQSRHEQAAAWVLMAGSRAADGDARGSAEAIVRTTALLEDGVRAATRLNIYNWLSIAYESLGLQELRLRVLRQYLDVSLALDHETVPQARLQMTWAMNDVHDLVRPVDAPEAARLMDEARSQLPQIERERAQGPAWRHSFADTVRGAVLARVGEFGDAIGLLRGVCQGGPEVHFFHRVAAHLELARALAACGHAEQAAATAAAAVGLVRSQSPADRLDLLELQSLAELQRLCGRHEEAQACRERSASLFQRNVMALLDAQVEGLTRRVGEQTLLLQNASLREVNIGLNQQARTDSLTGMLNRRALAQAYGALQAQERPPIVVIMDLDRFKSINDRFSHAVGDAVLGRIAVLMNEVLRDADVLGRYGGEEFVALLADADTQRGCGVVERLLAHVASHDWASIAPGLTVTFSAGLVKALPSEPFDGAVDRADALLYKAKRAGRNRVVTEGEAA